MNTDAQQIRRKFKQYYVAGLLVAGGFVFLFLAITFSAAQDYPLVRLTSGLFGALAILSGAGVFARKKWVSWSLLLLLISIYGVFGATHHATGETSTAVLFIAFVILPPGAFLFWRTVKKIVYPAGDSGVR